MRPPERPIATPISLTREDFEILIEALDELDEILEEDATTAEEIFKRSRAQRLALQISNVYLRAFIEKGAA